MYVLFFSVLKKTACVPLNNKNQKPASSKWKQAKDFGDKYSCLQESRNFIKKRRT